MTWSLLAQKERSYKFGTFIYVPVYLYVATCLKNGWNNLISQVDCFVSSFNEHLFKDLFPVSEGITIINDFFLFALDESTWNLVFYGNCTILIKIPWLLNLTIVLGRFKFVSSHGWWLYWTLFHIRFII